MGDATGTTRAPWVRRHRPLGAAAAVAALALTVLAGGCGSEGPASPADGPTPTELTDGSSAPPTSIDATTAAALDRWASFPVDAEPRPLVLLGGDVTGPLGGFASDEAKEAFLQGAFVDPASLPSGPAAADGYDVVTAAQAVELLRDSGTPGPEAVRPLVITSVQLGRANFETDRGSTELPAWMVSMAGVEAPAAVLAVSPDAIFRPPGDDLPPPFGATGTDTSTELTISFSGAPPGTGPCGAEYTADAVGSETAVAVTIRELPASPSTTDGRVACSSVGYARQLTISLASPLGARVLVAAATGAAVPVHG
jgi:hypothetical protein